MPEGLHSSRSVAIVDWSARIHPRGNSLSRISAGLLGGAQGFHGRSAAFGCRSHAFLSRLSRFDARFSGCAPAFLCGPQPIFSCAPSRRPGTLALLPCPLKLGFDLLAVHGMVGVDLHHTSFVVTIDEDLVRARKTIRTTAVANHDDLMSVRIICGDDFAASAALDLRGRCKRPLGQDRQAEQNH